MDDKATQPSSDAAPPADVSTTQPEPVEMSTVAAPTLTPVQPSPAQESGSAIAASEIKMEVSGAAVAPVVDVEAGVEQPQKPSPAQAPTISTLDYLKEKPRVTFYQKFIQPYSDKGTVSNWITFCFMLAGLAMVNWYPHTASDYVLAFGLFGFAGGITNWLAVKMLFDKIPGIYGSGIIPKQFKVIRKTVKDVMLATFFDPQFLTKYMKEKSAALAENVNFGPKIQKALESEAFDRILDEKLAELSTRPEGMYIAMMGMTPEMLKPMVKPFISGMGGDVVTQLLKTVDLTEVVDVNLIRTQVDIMMTKKLEELTPEVVKRLMEVVMKEHLGWLIVWGNVFGGAIGLVSKAAGY